MILVDTSIWIDIFSRRPTVQIPLQFYPVLCTCGPIIQEVLQGISEMPHRQTVKEGLLALSIVADPLAKEVFIEAGEIFAMGRKRGLTIRSSIDCLIAAIAIRHKLTLFHRDRDFSAIATFTDLNVVDRLSI